MTRRSVRKVTVLALGATAALIAWLALRPDPAAPVRVAPAPPDAEPWPERPWLLRAGPTGREPRPGYTHTGSVRSADSGAEVTFERRQCRHGFVRADDLPDAIPGPRILVLGDDQLTGAVDNRANAAARLEAALRETRPTATVLNAAVDGDDLADYLLRAEHLVPRYRPALIVVAVDVADDLFPRGTEDRRGRALLEGAIEPLVLEAIERLGHLARMAPRRSASLLVAVVPPSDPALAALHDAFVAALADEGQAFVTLPAAEAVQEALFWADGRLSNAGHIALADALAPRVERILEALAR